MSKPGRPQATVSALRRGIAVLQCFGEGAHSLSNAEIAERTRVPKPTVTRLAATLVCLGLMRQDPETERYSLGAGVLPLARNFLSGLDVRMHARPHMARLAEHFGASAFLAVRDGLDMVLIEASRARSSVLTVRMDVGSRLPMLASALGRAYLSALPETERAQLLDEFHHSHPEDWPRLRAGVEQALDDAATHGYCASLGELRAEVNSIAVPLTLPGGEHVTLNCGGPAFAFPETRLRTEVAPRLLAAARAIAGEVGGSLQQTKAA
jgi:IclR family transcriptional regulator, positive regulator for flagellar biogenesis